MVNLEQLSGLLDQALATETTQSWNERYAEFLLEGIDTYFADEDDYQPIASFTQQQEATYNQIDKPYNKAA